ncbi:iron(III) transport system permease protein [Faunimonas pinastri]|uniref:Iron(III) transport system permease protein n=1 Tax=Faunimonas pinastri TaxID=1855383 RepID=A0A1H9AAP3_9HYPH|nr:iron ABC transporter permease [Faunimonas pinastri]SEP73730.1 iron(III) transport system permease protein [Faunimonas pinastri]
MADTSLSAVPALPGRRRGLQVDGEKILLAVLLVYVGLFALTPLALLFAKAFGRGETGEFLGMIREQWQSVAVQRALWNTLKAGALSTLISLVIGTAMALLVGITDIRARSPLVFVLLLPMLIPSQITALAWIEMTGPQSPILLLLGAAPDPGTKNPIYSMAGISAVMGVEHATLVFLTVRAGLRRVPRDLVEASRLAGAGPLRSTVSVVLPLAGPAVLAGAALAFVSSIGNFGVPALLAIPARYPMITTLIYQRLSGFGPDALGSVAALALILSVLAAAGLTVRAFAARRTRMVVEATSAILPRFQLGRWRLPVEAATWVLLVLIAILPLVALVTSSLAPALGVPLNGRTLTLDNYRFALFAEQATRRAFANSLFLAFATAVASGLASVGLAYLAVIRRSRLARIIDLIADAPYVIPGTVLATGVILTFLRPLPFLHASIYGTIWILLAAYFGRFLTLALRPTMAGLEVMEKAVDEAAQVAGAGPMRRLFSIILPMATPAAAAGALLIFMSALNELTVSALLWSTGHETLGVMVFSLQHEGNSPAASALAVAAVLVTIALAGLLALFGRRLPQGIVPWQA